MRAMLSKFLTHAVALAVIAGAVLLPAHAADEAGSAIVVLDGSGSMGGPLEGQTDVKFDMASRALLSLLPTALPQSRTGLVTFGNRRKGDCGDVSVAVEPAPGNMEQFSTVFGKIGPTGKGPLVAGLREAAKLFPAGSPGTLIVVHDDVDNCRQDVCAAATDLAKLNPKLAVHVITISLDPATTHKMSCLATATGGRSFDARDAESVEAALSEALKLARVIDPAAPAIAAVPEAAPAPEIEGPPSVHVSAALSADGAALTTPVQWRIFPAGTVAGAGQMPLKVATRAVLASELAPGSYEVEARLGYASARQTITVADRGQTRMRVSLEAANLKVSGSAGKNGEPLAAPVLTVIARNATPEGATGAAASKPIHVSHDAQSDLVLPAGTYSVSISDGLASKQQVITLSAGDSKSVDFQLGTGRLELSATNRDGGETLDGATFVISVDDPDAPQGRREVARSLAPRPSFVLAAGTYYVTVILGAAEIKDRLAIGTGDVVKRAIPLNGATVSLTAAVDPALAPAASPIVFRVLSTGKDERELARVNSQTGAAAVDLFLAQGSYRIEATMGRLNVKGRQEADIVAGPNVPLAIKIAASELTLLPAGSAAAGPPASWDLRDGQGRVVQRSLASRAQKTLLIAPGRYMVGIESGGTRIDKPVDLKPGDRQTLSIAPN